MKTIKILLVMFLFAGPINAQQLVLKDALSIGVGSIFAEEAVTFNPSALFFAMHWRGLELPLNISSGVCLELSHRPDAPAANVISYTVCSLNRADIVGGFYAGTDMKIVDNNNGDFDLRIVTGTLLGEIGPGNLALEVYSLEEDRPIYFALLYRF